MQTPPHHSSFPPPFPLSVLLGQSPQLFNHKQLLNESNRRNCFRNYLNIGFSAAFKDLIFTITAWLDLLGFNIFFFFFRFLTSFLHQYSPSRGKFQGAQPGIPWAAGSWSDTCWAACPSSRSPPEEPGRCLLCSARRVFFMWWHHSFYGAAEAASSARLQPLCRAVHSGAHAGARVKTKADCRSAELGLIAPLWSWKGSSLLRPQLNKKIKKIISQLQLLCCILLVLAVFFWMGVSATMIQT